MYLNILLTYFCNLVGDVFENWYLKAFFEVLKVRVIVNGFES